MAYSNLATFGDSLALGTRALELAQRIGDNEIAILALATLGFAESRGGMTKGVENSPAHSISPVARGFQSRLGERMNCLV